MAEKDEKEKRSEARLETPNREVEVRSSSRPDDDRYRDRGYRSRDRDDNDYDDDDGDDNRSSRRRRNVRDVRRVSTDLLTLPCEIFGDILDAFTPSRRRGSSSRDDDDDRDSNDYRFGFEVRTYSQRDDDDDSSSGGGGSSSGGGYRGGGNSGGGRSKYRSESRTYERDRG
jgi:hypothetical protein